MEDHFGDMDFKVAGTENGITALQMDIKVKGITREIFQEALAQANKARKEILANMLATIPEPRKTALAVCTEDCPDEDFRRQDQGLSSDRAAR